MKQDTFIFETKVLGVSNDVASMINLEYQGAWNNMSEERMPLTLEARWETNTTRDLST